MSIIVLPQRLPLVVYESTVYDQSEPRIVAFHFFTHVQDKETPSVSPSYKLLSSAIVLQLSIIAFSGASMH